MSEISKEKYEGNDNYGNPKSDYLKKISDMDESALSREISSVIYMSAFCSNNPRADWHWMADACYDECAERGKIEIYTAAHRKLVSEYS